MRYFQLTASVLVLSACASSPPLPELVLAKGAYRLEGQCTSMRSISHDETSQCEGVMGIITKDPSAPEFLFQRKDKGAWLFVASGLATYSSDGKTATYPVSSVLDMSTNRAHDLAGQCSLKLEQAPAVACHVSLSSGTKLKEAAFRSSGTWSFRRDAQ